MSGLNTGEDMPNILKSTIVGGLAVLALAGCKQENNYPATQVTTEAADTVVVPVPGETVGVPVPGPTVAVPVPGPTSTVTATPTPEETRAR